MIGYAAPGIRRFFPLPLARRGFLNSFPTDGRSIRPVTIVSRCCIHGTQNAHPSISRSAVNQPRRKDNFMRAVLLTDSPNMAYVDDCDYLEIVKYKWYQAAVKHLVYARTKVNGVEIPMHRMIMNASKGTIIDHIDHNGLNNCRSNLRFCNMSQNNANRRQRTNTKHEFKGIRQRRKLFYAQIGAYGYRYISGPYSTIQEAAKVYDVLALKYFGDFAETNFDKSLYQDSNFIPEIKNIWIHKRKDRPNPAAFKGGCGSS